MNNYNREIKKLNKNNQNQIANIFDSLNDTEKVNLKKQISRINFKKVNNLYKELSKKQKDTNNEIKEIVAVNKENLSPEELKRYNTLGEQIIKNNKYALVTMSGGQGTRLRI